MANRASPLAAILALLMASSAFAVPKDWKTFHSSCGFSFKHPVKNWNSFVPASDEKPQCSDSIEVDGSPHFKNNELSEPYLSCTFSCGFPAQTASEMLAICNGTKLKQDKITIGGELAGETYCRDYMGWPIERTIVIQHQTSS